jgi:hypothetical protein
MFEIDYEGNWTELRTRKKVKILGGITQVL